MKFDDFKKYAKELINLAWPIIMGNLGIILIAAGDVFVAGKHSTETLAAISIAAAITSCISMFGIGLIISVSPVLSNLRGMKKPVKKFLFPTIRFALLIGVISCLITLGLIPFVDKFGYEENLVLLIKEYIFITSFSIFGGYMHAALKEYFQAYEIVFFPNLLTLISVVLNLLLNFLFVFGWGPIPPMGAKGLAVATLFVRTFMGGALLAYCFYYLRCSNYYDHNYYKSLIKVGLPISFAISIEFVAFNLVAILMGRISGNYAAAQNIINVLTTFSFMIPLALSNAIAVKVGYANGANNFKDLKNYSITGVTMSQCFMALSSIVFITIPVQLVKLFTTDPVLIKVCLPIMYSVAIFQLFDGLQVSLGGIFKGMKKTSVVMITNLLGYWGLSIPLGILFAFHFKLYLLGFWISLGIGSATICLIFTIFLTKEFAKRRNRQNMPVSSANDSLTC